MQTPTTSSTGLGRRTFHVSCIVLTGIALAQGVAMAKAWRDIRPPVSKSKIPLTLTEVTQPKPDKPDKPTVLVKDDPFSTVAAGEDPHPEMAAPVGPELKLRDPAEPVLARPLVLSAPLDLPITDEECLRHLDEGVYLRERGEMQGAVTELRAALKMNPTHPQLLYQTALTLDMMSLEGKAVAQWMALKKLGEGAGNYYQLALARLKENSAVPANEEAEEEKEGRFSLGPVTVERLANTVDGEVLRFHASVKRLQAEPVDDVNKILMKLHLFDEVNGKRIDRTTALRPVEQWLDLPVNWVDGTETFDFEYRQAPLSADEIVKLGQRKYYGYAIELRYGDKDAEKLQDMTAEPRDLEALARELPEETAAPVIDSLDAPLPAGQPDGTLFPGEKFDR